MTLDLAARDRAFVIAEAGTAHANPCREARLRKALELVDAAASAGADAVKFQWFWQYDGANPLPLRDDMFCWFAGDEARLPRWLASVMGRDEWAQVKEYAEACGLVFLASTFQHATVSWMGHLGVVASKVASRAAKEFPYDFTPKPHLVSLGMFDALYAPLDAFLIECEARYPSTRRWKAMRPGYSDHSGRPFNSIDAISRGCALVEVHYRINRVSAGPDLPATLSVDELRLVCEARNYYANRSQQ